MASTYPIILYDSIFTGSSMSASATVAGYSVDNLSDYRSYTQWQAASSGIVWIKCHCTAARAANSIGIVGHNLYSKDATISVQMFTSDSVTAADWSTALSGFKPDNDYALFKDFETSAERLWWKITIQCATIVTIGEIIIGDKIQLPGKPMAPVSPYSIGAEIETNRSKAGHILGSVVRYKPLSISHKIAPAEGNYDWWSSVYRSFMLNHALNMKPFFYVMDAGADTAKTPKDAFWVKLDDSMKYSLNMLMGGRVEEMTLTMSGVYE